MSFSQFIKDYIDAINSFYDAYSGHINFVPFLQFTLIYLGQGTKFLIEYIITFRWLIDFCSIKIVIPEIINSNFVEEYSLEDPMFRFFDFFEIYNKHINTNPYLTGILNSFFYCLPFSAGNIYWLRRLTIEGIPGAIAAGLGIFVAQFFILIGILFGFRFLIFPWLSYELVHYVVGVVLTFFLMYRTVMKPLMRVKAKETDKLVKIFLFHLGFTWAEQTTFFQYLSNVTFTPQPTIFEGVSGGGEDYSAFTNPIFLNGFYFLGILFGIVFWFTTFGAFFIWLGHALSEFFNFQYSRWVRGVHYYSMLLMVAIAITSFPYYNADYLVTSPFGFTKNDEGATQFHIKTYSKDWRKGRLGEYSVHSSYDTDPAPFDHGRYVTGREVEQTFEDLNYQGEYAWRSRNDRLAVGSRGLVNKWLRAWISDFKKTKAKGSQRKIPLANLDEKNPNRWKYFDIYSTIYPFFSTREGLIQRFVDDYQQDVSRSAFPDKHYEKFQDPPYVPFGELSKYGFDVFASTVDFETDEFEESLGRRIKNKYFSNYVYHNILTVDMSLFLNRQPKKHFLKADDENALFQKRQILGSYYDSLREYSKLPYYEAYGDLFLGPKSYANRVYNQQFKGTLKIVKRLFSISLENRQNLSQKSILKFDQPLYTSKNNEKEQALHEELLNNLSDLKDQEPFLEEINPIPFYAGWDEELRKFSITNYLLPHTDSSIKTDFYNKTNDEFETIYFLNWPLSDSKLDSVKRSPKPPVNLLFNVYDDPAYVQERDLFEYPIGDNLQVVSETLPSVVRRLDLRERDKVNTILHPLRGGYVWATDPPLKIKLKEDLIDYLPPLLREKVREIRGWRDSNP